MKTITVSPKFQVVIPKTIREITHVRAGMKCEMIPYSDRIEIIPIRPIKKMRGFLRGMDTTITREKDRV